MKNKSFKSVVLEYVKEYGDLECTLRCGSKARIQPCGDLETKEYGYFSIAEDFDNNLRCTNDNRFDIIVCSIPNFKKRCFNKECVHYEESECLLIGATKNCSDRKTRPDSWKDLRSAEFRKDTRFFCMDDPRKEKYNEGLENRLEELQHLRDMIDKRIEELKRR